MLLYEITPLLAPASTCCHPGVHAEAGSNDAIRHHQLREPSRG
eukprot:CAMPEP_0195079468 /NCGR_PEP_ID=MMETSP0448-20130528/21377_1 /TAXON_ID=66468 /ORGANISM="Heterocapsa triquestra, Strain CCMP 448" /LENGTH=42 /DNA_ID= /DNA_START= /DNA_END= /DNA_ORIENTATION=